MTSAECRQLLASVSAYLDGDLEAGACQSIEDAFVLVECLKRQSIETHCHDCAGCAEIVAGLRETAGLCRQAGSVPVPEAVRRRALARVRRLLDGPQNAESD